MLIAQKIMMFILFFCICIVLKNVFKFVASFSKDEKMQNTTKDNIILASAVSYIMTIIFTGFKLF